MESLVDRIKASGELPVFPGILAKLVGMLSDDNVDMSEIEKTIITDPALGMTVMGVANSAAFAGTQKISELSLAINRLGTSALRRIVLAKQAEILFKDGSESFGLAGPECWEGSLAGAIAAELIATKFKCCDPNVAFTAGLLRDCGMLIIDRLGVPDELQAAMCADSDFSAPERERQSYGFDHAQVGAILGEQWGLPEELVQAIRFHHTPPEEPAIPLADCVHCADLVAKQLGYGVGLDGLSYSFNQGAHDRLNIDYQSIMEIIADLRMQMEQFQELMDAGQGSQAA